MEHIRLIEMPYRGERRGAERSTAPAYLNDDDLRAQLDPATTVTVTLADDEERQYGEWHRVGLANRHLSDAVASALNDGVRPIGLLANCNALMGMLAGLQHAGRERIGLIWIDAHADFNTPETTLSGMLGGMPVAVSAGLCLHRLRQTSGMSAPLPCDNIIMYALRDVDGEEQALLDEHAVRQVAVGDIDGLMSHANDLAGRVDGIYVHVDMDVLDPAEVAGHPLTVPGGPSSEALAGALRKLRRITAVCSAGIASAPSAEHDPSGVSRRAAHRLIVAAAHR